MLVKELIEQLSQLDPEMNVIGQCTDPTGYTYKVPIEKIGLDDPYDSNGYSALDGSEIGDNDDEYNEDGDFIGMKCVIIDLGDV